MIQYYYMTQYYYEIQFYYMIHFYAAEDCSNVMLMKTRVAASNQIIIENDTMPNIQVSTINCFIYLVKYFICH